MNSIVERLRDTREVYAGLMCCTEAADLIESQEKRFQELEAENARLRQERIARLAFESVYADTEFKKIRDELSALRQRIADAPVVAEVAKGNLGNRLMWDTEDAQVLTPVGTKLISKEDLK